MKIFGREPAVAVAFLVALLQALSLVLDFDTDTQGYINAALVAVGGVITAALVRVDSALPLLVGAGQAVIAAVLALGLEIPANAQATVMAVLAVLAGQYVRTQVVASVPAQASAAPAYPRTATE